MSARVYNLLFLCRANSIRSIMAEAILRKMGAAHFRAYSAGSQPSDTVHPLALKVLEDYKFPTEGLRSKSWDEFATAGAPDMDFVFTVCDDTAAAPCPEWPGYPMTAHWSIDDPLAVDGSAVEQERAFVLAFKYLRTRIGIFLSLPLARIDALALSTKLREIGHTEGQSAQGAQGRDATL